MGKYVGDAESLTGKGRGESTQYIYNLTEVVAMLAVIGMNGGWCTCGCDDGG
jgi:hypothetical protein